MVEAKAKEMEAETKKLIEKDMMDQVSNVKIGEPAPDEIIADIKEIAKNTEKIKKPTHMVVAKEDNGTV